MRFALTMAAIALATSSAAALGLDDVKVSTEGSVRYTRGAAYEVVFTVHNSSLARIKDTRIGCGVLTREGKPLNAIDTLVFNIESGKQVVGVATGRGEGAFSAECRPLSVTGAD